MPELLRGIFALSLLVILLLGLNTKIVQNNKAIDHPEEHAGHQTEETDNKETIDLKLES